MSIQKFNELVAKNKKIAKECKEINVRMQYIIDEFIWDHYLRLCDKHFWEKKLSNNMIEGVKKTCTRYGRFFICIPNDYISYSYNGECLGCSRLENDERMKTIEYRRDCITLIDDDSDDDVL